MNISRDLIRECFGPDARIWGCWPLGYTVTLPSGSSIEIAQNGELTKFKGDDIYPLAMRFYAALGFRSVTVKGNAQHVMLCALHGQAVGVEVCGNGKQGWFSPPTPLVPRVSGAYGNSRLASLDDVQDCGLSGGTWGHGLTIGEDTAGNILRYSGPNGICLIAPPGAGKNTTCITRLLAEAENTSLVVVDPKGELLAINRRRRASIGPTRHIAPVKDGLPEELHHFVDSSDSYNPLWGLNPKSDSYVAENDSIAQMVVAPDDSQQGKDSGFFDEGAQAIVSGLTQYLIEFEPDKATLPRMAEIASTNELFDVGALAMQYASTAIKARLAIVGDEHAREMRGGINDILRTLRKGVRFLTDPAIARIFQTPKEPWDFEDLKHGARPGTVFISIPAKFTNITRPVFRVLSGCAVSRLQSTPPGEWRVACLIDEFPMLGRVPVFLTAFAEGRGHGISMLPIAQEPSQIVTAYTKEGLRTILAGCEVQLFYAPRTYEAAQEIAAMAGRASILTASYSQGGRHGEAGNISIGETGKDVLTPSQILGLRPDEMIVCAPGLLNNVLTIAKRRGYWTYPEIRPLVDPNPYWKGDRQKTKSAPAVSAANPSGERRMVERLARAAKAAESR
jgi:type IV secretion system protein VirD4